MRKNVIATFPDGQKISSAVLSSYGNKLKDLITERIKHADLGTVHERTILINSFYSEIIETCEGDTAPVQIVATSECAVIQKTMTMYTDWVQKKLFVGPAALEYLLEIILIEIDKEAKMLFSLEELKERVLYSEQLLERYQKKWSENKRCDNSYGEHAIRQVEEIVNWIFE